MAKKYSKYLPLGVAVAAGAALWFYTSKAKASPTPVGPIGPPGPPLPPVEPPDPTPPGPPVEPPKPTGSTKRNAPAFPFTTSEAQGAEAGVAVGEHATWYATLTTTMEENGNETTTPSAEDIKDAKQKMGMGGRSVLGWLTDSTFDALYGKNITIPAKANRGVGWQPFLDAWHRINALIKNMAYV